jgi:Tol biopolymer transport system component
MSVLRISRPRTFVASAIVGAVSLLAACSDTTAPVRETHAVPSAATSPAAAVVGATSNMIVLQRDSAGAQVYIVNPDGTGLARLGRGENPSWSPDHATIVFELNNTLFIMNADGTSARALTGVSGDRSASFTPDGKQVVFAHVNAKGQSDLFTVNADGTNRQPLVKTANISETAPRVSPDGTKLAYVSERRGETDIVVMDMTTGRRAVVVADPNPQLFPTWSPDSKRLAFTTSSGNAADCIAIADADGGNRKNFPSGVAGCASPSWSPDGTEIAFTSVSPGLTSVFRGKADVAVTPTRVTLNVPGIADVTTVWSR